MQIRRFHCLFSLVGIALLIGCGGGGGGPKGQTTTLTDTISLTTSPRLDDGNHCACFTLVALKSGQAQITANSTALDTFLVIEKLNSDGTAEVVANDDDSGGGTNSSLTLGITSGTTYTVWVTSGTDDSAGTVNVTIPSDYLGRVIQ